MRRYFSGALILVPGILLCCICYTVGFWYQSIKVLAIDSFKLGRSEGVQP